MNSAENSFIPCAAVILAAGLSRRMGHFKLLLPWRATTVLGQVVATLEAAGLNQIVVVTGHRHEEIAEALRTTPARLVFNPAYETGEMLSSIQAGLRALSVLSPMPTSPPQPMQTRRQSSVVGRRSGFSAQIAAALLCLGDQPQMEVATVQAVLAAGQATGWQQVVIPSYNRRGGHPILLPRSLWPAILAERDSLRALLAQHRSAIHYLTVDTPTILADLDTPADYAAASGQ